MKRDKAKQTFVNLPIFGCICEGLFRVYTSWWQLIGIPERKIFMNLNLKTRIYSGLFFVLTVLFFSSYIEKKKLNKWDKVNIDSNISKDIIYKELDKQKEIFSAIEQQDSSRKRTSDVSYFSKKKIDLNKTKYSKLNNCRAYYFHSDTLSINIGFSNGYSGRGFIIKYKNEKFYTEAYRLTDIIIEGEIEPKHKIVYQKLTLDKANYKLGDSLYGKIDFKSIETTDNGETIEHFGKGNFRTTVSEF